MCAAAAERYDTKGMGVAAKRERGGIPAVQICIEGVWPSGMGERESFAAGRAPGSIHPEAIQHPRGAAAVDSQSGPAYPSSHTRPRLRFE